jgi:hypothetical protein
MKTLIAILKIGTERVQIFAKNNKIINTDQELINLIGYILSQNNTASWSYQIKPSYNNKHIVQCEYFLNTKDGAEIIICGYGDNPYDALTNLDKTCEFFISESKISEKV